MAAASLKLGVLRACCCAMMLVHASPSTPFRPVLAEGAGDAGGEGAKEAGGEGAGEGTGGPACVSPW